jgi:hypothetical protein
VVLDAEVDPFRFELFPGLSPPLRRLISAASAQIDDQRDENHHPQHRRDQQCHRQHHHLADLLLRVAGREPPGDEAEQEKDLKDLGHRYAHQSDDVERDIMGAGGVGDHGQQCIATEGERREPRRDAGDGQEHRRGSWRGAEQFRGSG